MSCAKIELIHQYVLDMFVRAMDLGSVHLGMPRRLSGQDVDA